MEQISRKFTNAQNYWNVFHLESRGTPPTEQNQGKPTVMFDQHHQHNRVPPCPKVTPGSDTATTHQKSPPPAATSHPPNTMEQRILFHVPPPWVATRSGIKVDTVVQPETDLDEANQR